MTILAFFEQFSGKVCTYFWLLILSASPNIMYVVRTVRAGLGFLWAWGYMIVRGLFFILFFKVKTNHNWSKAEIHTVNRVFTLYAHIQMTHFLDLAKTKLLITQSAFIFSKSLFWMQSRAKEFNIF